MPEFLSGFDLAFVQRRPEFLVFVWKLFLKRFKKPVVFKIRHDGVSKPVRRIGVRYLLFKIREFHI